MSAGRPGERSAAVILHEVLGGSLPPLRSAAPVDVAAAVLALLGETALVDLDDAQIARCVLALQGAPLARGGRLRIGFRRQRRAAELLLLVRQVLQQRSKAP